jgi:hypothetical protein
MCVGAVLAVIFLQLLTAGVLFLNYRGAEEAGAGEGSEGSAGGLRPSQHLPGRPGATIRRHCHLLR